MRFVVDPRVATGGKLLAVFALLYLLSPVDLIPDLIPVLGWIDDVGLSALAFTLLARAFQKYREAAASAAASPPTVVETTGTDVPPR